MKKIIGAFAATLVSLALCSGLFVSCDAGEDNSQLVAAYMEAARRERDAADQAKLDNIGTYIHGAASRGDIYVRDSVIARHYSDSKKTHAVIYFEAIPSDGNTFSFAGLTVTTIPASTDLQYELYASKANYFKVKVPIETTKVDIDQSNAFVAAN